MTPLEQNLVNALIQKYKSQGVSVQAILDNPHFVALPLQSKLEAINLYAKELSTNPRFPVKRIGGAVLAGAGTTASLLALTRQFAGVGHLPPVGYATAGAIGGVLAGINAGMAASKEYGKFKDIAQEVDAGNSLQALVERSLHSMPSTPRPQNPILGKLHEINMQIHTLME